MDVREMMFGLGETFKYLGCAGCGTLYIAEIPADLGDYYGSKYYSFDADPEAMLGRPGIAQVAAAVGRSILSGDGRLGNLMRRTSERHVVALVDKYRAVTRSGLRLSPETRLLDVGAGSGMLVYALALAGFRQVTGIDPFTNGDVSFRPGGRVLKCQLGDVSGEFDLIMSHHSLEHVPDPATTLAQIRDRLAPGGRALVRMPTVSSEAYRRYRADWYQLDAPRHLTLFSRAGMTRLCARAGLSIVRVIDDSSAMQFWASDQVSRGVPLVSERSHLLHPSRSPYTRRQLSAWAEEATNLNLRGEGDQAAWVLSRT
jgi:SAM-dependent methyltransferase